MDACDLNVRLCRFPPWCHPPRTCDCTLLVPVVRLVKKLALATLCIDLLCLSVLTVTRSCRILSSNVRLWVVIPLSTIPNELVSLDTLLGNWECASSSRLRLHLLLVTWAAVVASSCSGCMTRADIARMSSMRNMQSITRTGSILVCVRCRILVMQLSGQLTLIVVTAPFVPLMMGSHVET